MSDWTAIDRIVKTIYDNPFLAKCAYFNKSAVPTWGTLYEYARVNGIGVRESDRLPASLLGIAVSRKPYVNVPDEHARHGRHDYFIVLKQSIPHGFAKFYVAAHELGHVLMHARLLAKPAQLAFATHVGHHSYISWSAEVEASAFALIVICPDNVLSDLEDRRMLQPRLLSDVYRERTGMFMPQRFACDRISAYELYHKRARSCGRWCFIGDALHEHRNGDT